MQQILHQSAGSGCLEAHRHTALLVLLKRPHVCRYGCLILPRWKADQLDMQHIGTQDTIPAAIEMVCAVPELSFNRAPEICFRLSVRGW